ncbi:SBBP repeat-containing protein [bacterium]|nr:SBBP repeat-containing protein [bacterium]
MSMGIDLYSEVGIAVSLPGNHTWSRSWGGLSDDRGNDVAVDSNGNIYVTGYYCGAVNFDPGGGTDIRNAASSADIFLSKFDSTGIYQGAVTLGGWGWEEGIVVTADNNNDVWITGYFSGIMDFDPGLGNAILTSVGGNDAFLAKYDSNLNYLWAGSWCGGDVFGDTGVALANDSYNNIYVTGEFHSTVDFDPGGNTFNLSAGTNAAVYLNKLDSAGNFQWAKAWCTEVNPAVGGMGTGVGIDGNNDVYLLGNFSGTADLDPGGATDMHTSHGATFDSFICKLQSNANFNWAKNWDAYSRGIYVNAVGDSFTTGNYENTVDFDPGGSINQLTSNGGWDVFLTKFDTTGTHNWALGWGGPVNDWGTAIDLNINNGYLNITGNFDALVDFNPGPSYFALPSKGGMDIFLNTITMNGDFICAQVVGGPGDDRACGVAGFYSYQSIVTGEFSGTVDFSFLPPADPQTSNGLHDIYLTTF